MRQQIEIVPQVKTERWGTSSTNVAACCLAYGFNLCPEQPYIRHAAFNKPKKVYTSIWFVPTHPNPGVVWQDPDDISGAFRALTPQDIEVAWRHWDELVKRQGRYAIAPEWREPFIFMRLGVDWRQWANEKLLWPSHHSPNFELDVAERLRPQPFKPYKVTDVYFAMCLLAAGKRVWAYKAGDWTFNELDGSKGLLQDYLDNGKQCRMQWHKAAILRYEGLLEDIKKQERKTGPDNVPLLWIRNGPHVALMPNNRTPKMQEQIIRMLTTM